jgi:hypothetical protein
MLPPGPPITLTLDRSEVTAIRIAILEAKKVPFLERHLDRLHRSQAIATRTLSKSKTPTDFKRAAWLLGVWKPAADWKPFKYPIDFIGGAYDALTEGDGQVTIGNERADFGLEEGLYTFDHCPLDPWEAIVSLVKPFGQKSPESLRRKLLRRRTEIQKLSPSERKVVGPNGLTLPRLLKLPDARTSPTEK